MSERSPEAHFTRGLCVHKTKFAKHKYMLLGRHKWWSHQTMVFHMSRKLSFCYICKIETLPVIKSQIISKRILIISSSTLLEIDQNGYDVKLEKDQNWLNEPSTLSWINHVSRNHVSHGLDVAFRPLIQLLRRTVRIIRMKFHLKVLACVSYELRMKYIWKSWPLRYFTHNYIWISYEVHMNFTWNTYVAETFYSYELHKNFIRTSYEFHRKYTRIIR